MHGRKHAWVYRLYSENTKVSQKSRSDFFVLKSVIVFHKSPKPSQTLNGYHACIFQKTFISSYPKPSQTYIVQEKACLSLCSLSLGALRGVPGEGLSVCRHRHALFHSLALLSALTFPLIYPRLFVIIYFGSAS